MTSLILVFVFHSEKVLKFVEINIILNVLAISSSIYASSLVLEKVVSGRFTKVSIKVSNNKVKRFIFLHFYLVLRGVLSYTGTR